MILEKRFDLEGKHAFLGASKYHWMNYDLDKLKESYFNFRAAQKGTELHQLAYDLIKQEVKLPRSKRALNRYVNDVIDLRSDGFPMYMEQPLYYSPRCFGTSDAIGCTFGDVPNPESVLYIFDLKTGKIPTSFHQLEIYCALFCLNYKIKFEDIGYTEFRLYQGNEVITGNPDPLVIADIKDKIILFDNELEKMDNERR